MARAKETLKASLVGTAEEPQLSQQVKAHFLQHARKDENTGELYMTEEDFIDAIAPKDEDYVSHLSLLPCLAGCATPASVRDNEVNLFCFISIAQDQT